ncbi:MAG: hypothetical protein IKA82_01790 [Clostridia bacterium]|nr:hypothetical protein [Clostridia bacterium]
MSKKRITSLCLMIALLLTSVLQLTACGYVLPGNTNSVTADTNDKSDDTEPDAVAPSSDFLLTQEEVSGDTSFALYAVYRRYASEALLIPGLKQYLVPQGMDIWDEKNLLIISGYFSADSVIDSSVLMAIDLASGNYVGEYYIKNADGTKNKSHVGGIAITEKDLFISSGNKLHRIPLSALEDAKDHGDVTIIESISVPCNASFCNYSGGVLWVGDFFLKESYPTDEYRHLINRDGEQYYAWCVGYKVDSSSKNGLAFDLPTNDGFATPDYVLSIQEKIQGFTVLSDKRIVLSQSYGRGNNSRLYFYENVLDTDAHTTVELNGRDIPVWFLDGKCEKDIIIAPPMAEGICEKDGNLYVLYESGADKYRNNGGKYPTDHVWVISAPD